MKYANFILAIFFSTQALAHSDGYPHIDKSGLSSSDAQAIENFELYANSIYPIDNDGDHANYSFAKDELLSKLSDVGVLRVLLQAIDHKYFHFKRSFEQVLNYLTPQIEESFDYYLMVNVSYEKYGDPRAFIPSQHMRVLKKGPSGQIFLRNSQEQITGISEDALGIDQPALEGLDTLIPVSSGASHFGASYVDTFSGLFRVNLKKSHTHRYQEGMIDSLYVDVNYPFGIKKKSGIAIHGTPRSNYKHLGNQASHGCVRVHQSVSSKLYKLVMKTLPSVELPVFGKYDRLPTVIGTKPGKRVLMVFFYGYEADQNGVSI